ncbi:hypothetical protein D3C87_1946130 [compost metagenome]
MRMELAIMLPLRTSFCSTSQAPAPIATTWSTIRIVRAMEAIRVTRSFALTTGTSAASLSRRNSRIAPCVHPIARMRLA